MNIGIESYLNDGANYKAQAILAIVRGNVGYIQEGGTNHKDVQVYVGRFENCREQGYVFSLYYKYNFIKHYAVYEHRNSDEICVLFSRAITINTPNANQMFGERGKYDVDKFFHHDQIVEAANFVIEDMRNELHDYCEKLAENKEKTE